MTYRRLQRAEGKKRKKRNRLADRLADRPVPGAPELIALRGFARVRSEDELQVAWKSVVGEKHGPSISSGQSSAQAILGATFVDAPSAPKVCSMMNTTPVLHCLLVLTPCG